MSADVAAHALPAPEQRCRAQWRSGLDRCDALVANTTIVTPVLTPLVYFELQKALARLVPALSINRRVHGPHFRERFPHDGGVRVHQHYWSAEALGRSYATYLCRPTLPWSLRPSVARRSVPQVGRVCRNARW